MGKRQRAKKSTPADSLKWLGPAKVTFDGWPEGERPKPIAPPRKWRTLPPCGGVVVEFVRTKRPRLGQRYRLGWIRRERIKGPDGWRTIGAIKMTDFEAANAFVFIWVEVARANSTLLARCVSSKHTQANDQARVWHEVARLAWINMVGL